MMFCANVKIFNALLTNKFMPRLVRGFAFVPTKAVLVRKRIRTFGAHKPKAPLCNGPDRLLLPFGQFTFRELTPKAAEGLFCGNLLFLQSLRLASQATSLYTREALVPPDSTPKRYNTLYLAGKECEKEYEQFVRTPFVVGRGLAPVGY